MSAKKTPRRKSPPNTVERSGVAASGPELVVFVSGDELGSAVMAACWFQTLAAPAKARCVVGAFRDPPVRTDPHLALAMRAAGCDVAGVTSRLITSELLNEADLVITTGQTFERGFIGTPGCIRREHWLVEPASGFGQGRLNGLRELIRSRVAMLVFTEGWGRADIPREAARVTRPRWHIEALAHA